MGEPAAHETLSPSLAQLRNAERMTDRELVREYRIVTGFPERPPIRVAWINVLYNEIAKRGLTTPVES